MSSKKSAGTRLYEGMFLFDTNLASKDWPGLETHVEDVLKKNSGELLYAERWPDRKLAYEIRGCKKGTYYLTYFQAPSESIPGLERDCQLSERVLRLLVVQDEGLEDELERCRKRAASASSGDAEREPSSPEPAPREGSAEPKRAPEV